MRLQNPGLQRTTGKGARWYVRPYVDGWNDKGEIIAEQQRIYIGDCSTMNKREAEAKRREIIDRINRRQYVLQAQMRFGDFLDFYLVQFVRRTGNLSASTQAKYECQIKNHIRPAFEDLAMAEITVRRIDDWLDLKAKGGMAPSSRTDLRNILSGIFTQARRQGVWREANPVELVTVRNNYAVRQHRKLTAEETIRLLAALPEDVALICRVALFTTMRISEVLGLQWKHLDFERGLFTVRQRFHRGDLSVPKSPKSNRDLAMGHLAEDLARIHPGPGNDERFVFGVTTHKGTRAERITRDDRDINQHFLRPAAKALNIYWKGFGFHSFRREAITELARELDSIQMMRVSGHTKIDMQALYGQADMVRQDKAVRSFQERLMGRPEGKVS